MPESQLFNSLFFLKKSSLQLSAVWVLLLALSLTSCKKNDDNQSVGSVSATLNQEEFFSNNLQYERGTVVLDNTEHELNTLIFISQMNERIILYFLGDSIGTHTPLTFQSYPSARYVMNNGITYDSSEGIIDISTFEELGDDKYRIEGFFEFIAEDFELMSGQSMNVNNGQFGGTFQPIN